jgi:hypothetical protein
MKQRTLLAACHSFLSTRTTTRSISITQTCQGLIHKVSHRFQMLRFAPQVIEAARLEREVTSCQFILRVMPREILVMVDWIQGQAAGSVAGKGPANGVVQAGA